MKATGYGICAGLCFLAAAVTDSNNLVVGFNLIGIVTWAALCLTEGKK